MKSLRIAVQMDPIETMIVNHDTSLMLMVEAQARGHEIWWWSPNDLFYDTGDVKARARRVSVSFEEAKHYETHEEAVRAVDEFDVVLVRQDPPFDMGYISNTYLLELATKALVINPPRGIRNISEKTSILQFPELTPTTWVGRDLVALEAFARRFDQVVLKILFMMGGEGVIKLSASDPEFQKKARAFLSAAGREPILAQEFLPAVSGGDKRVFVLNGEPFAALKRLPKEGDFRANLAVGGQAAAGELDDADREIAATVAPLLKREGIVFAGLDVIAGKLIEINVTSPTLAQELKRLSGLDLPKAFWDRVEQIAA
ncbi:MAG TPA: glutathione synthase [Vitreimonas sp.]|uniref:glutathione synthase n=1 Tax=Vitreimonas sp. TaxID=3069702 RepID=UPI002D27E659|nr:glutathione synthase [Vitreimonas sp.]HYD87532.1 glutathione synthase [Vitreimonas sp.]